MTTLLFLSGMGAGAVLVILIIGILFLRRGEIAQKQAQTHLEQNAKSLAALVQRNAIGDLQLDQLTRIGDTFERLLKHVSEEYERETTAVE